MTHIPSEHCAGYWCLFSLCPGPVRRILRAGTRSDQELESKKEEGNLTERRNWPVCPWIRWVHNKEEKFPIHCKGEHHDWSGRGPVPRNPPNPFISLESKTKKTIAVPRVHSHLPIAGSLAPLSGQGLGYRQATAADGSLVHRGVDLRNTEMRCTALLRAILLLKGDCNFGFDHHRCVATYDSAAGGLS